MATNSPTTTGPTTPPTRSRWSTRVDPGSGTRVDLFVLGTVVTILLTRGYLAATGYPQVGGSGGLHVAHVLWGGLLMAVAILLAALRSGPRTRARAALVGGVGFGLFLDEVGKFVTKTNDYFYRPAFAIMYAVVVILLVAAHEAVRRRSTDDATRLVDAAQALTDLLRGELDEQARQAALRRLGAADGQHHTATVLAELLTSAPAAAPRRAGADAVVRGARRQGEAALRVILARRRLVIGVLVVLALFALLSVPGSVLALLTADDGPLPDTSQQVGLVTVAVSSALTLVGVVMLARGATVRGLRVLRAGVLVDLLVTDLLTIVDSQLGGVPDVLIDLVLLAALTVALRLSVDERSDDQSAPAAVDPDGWPRSGG